MSDNIPFEIQMEIIKKVSHVKSLIQLRSVSKPWNSFIDSSQFIKGYGARHTQPHSHILMYEKPSERFMMSSQFEYAARHICLVDDNIETLQVQEVAPSVVMSPLLKQYHVSYVVGVSHGLLCFYGFHEGYKKWMLVIWNRSIGKSFGIAVPFSYSLVFGFGVCPVNRDPTVVKVLCAHKMPWHVEVFTLSSGVWNVIPSSNLPRQSIELRATTHVFIDRFIYWGACEETFTDDGEDTTNHMVVSFDLITKEFKVVNLPNSFTNNFFARLSVSKLRGSLVVFGNFVAEEGIHFGIWVMEHDLSFRKLFSIGGVSEILVFRKNGETIIETPKENERFTTLGVYDPCSQQIKNLGICEREDSFFMGSYKESLLLLDHLDSHIYYDNNRSK